MESVKWSAWLAVFLGSALTSPVAGESGSAALELNIQMIPEIWINGATGAVGIEYTTNLDQTSGWTPLATVQATNSAYFYLDAAATGAPRRFYRAASAAQAVELTIQTIPGIWITGAAGAVSIEYSTNRNQTNRWTLLANVQATNGAVSIEYNTNLDQTSDWTLLGNVQATNTPYLYIAATPTTTNAPKRFYRVVSPPQVVWIPAGTFTMGSPSTEVDRGSYESPTTQVTISKGYWMSKHETSREEYRFVMGTNPSYFKGDTERPVEQVSWNDATNYCAALTMRERAAGRLPSGYAYRLPTEAEWEYACRAGTTTRFGYGDDPDYTQLGEYAWYADNSYTTSKPSSVSFEMGGCYYTTYAVGQKKPNAWGLYDMHGNVWEWCLDWHGTYPGGSVTDPRGPTTGSSRVVRGGSWRDYGRICRSAYRYINSPAYRRYDLGFRPVLAPVQ